MPYSTRQICIPDHDEPRLGSELPVLSLAPNGVHSCASGGAGPVSYKTSTSYWKRNRNNLP